MILLKGCLSTVFLFKIISYDLNQVDKNPVDLKGSQIDNNAYLADY